jgi:hypothetical protein
VARRPTIRPFGLLLALALALASTLHAASTAFGLAGAAHTHGFGLSSHAHGSAGPASASHHSDGNGDHHPVAGLCIAMAGVTLPGSCGVSIPEAGVVWDDVPAASPEILKPKIPDPPPRQ